MRQKKPKTRLSDAQAIALYRLRDGQEDRAGRVAPATHEALVSAGMVSGAASARTITPKGLDWLRDRGWLR